MRRFMKWVTARVQQPLWLYLVEVIALVLVVAKVAYENPSNVVKVVLGSILVATIMLLARGGLTPHAKKVRQLEANELETADDAAFGDYFLRTLVTLRMPRLMRAMYAVMTVVMYVSVIFPNLLP